MIQLKVTSQSSCLRDLNTTERTACVGPFSTVVCLTAVGTLGHTKPWQWYYYKQYNFCYWYMYVTSRVFTLTWKETGDNHLFTNAFGKSSRLNVRTPNLIRTKVKGPRHVRTWGMREFHSVMWSLRCVPQWELDHTFISKGTHFTARLVTSSYFQTVTDIDTLNHTT